MRVARGICLLILLSVSLAWIALPGAGSASGAADGTAQNGCTCHALQPSNFATVTLAGLEGSPPTYAQARAYELTLTVSKAPDVPPSVQNQGGFAVRVDPMGGLAPIDDKTQMKGNTLTHTAAGNDQRSWTFRWTPPANATGPATIYLAGNAVNGDGVADPADFWTKTVMTVEPLPPASSAPPSPTPATPPPAGTPAPAALATVVVAVAVLVGRRRG